MSYHGVQTTTIDSNSKFTGVVDIKGCNNVAVELQTYSVFAITATCNVYLNVCDSTTGTFRRVSAMGVYSGGSGIYNFEVPSGSGNHYVIADVIAGFNYAKVEFSNTCTATATIRVHKLVY